MDTAKIKTFFVNHFEKMILAGVVCASGYLAVTGFGLSHITDEHDPNSLTDRARQVKTEIDADRTDAIVGDREPALDVVGRTGRRAQRLGSFHVVATDPHRSRTLAGRNRRRCVATAARRPTTLRSTRSRL